jgi:hypothetical protein
MIRRSHAKPANSRATDAALTYFKAHACLARSHSLGALRQLGQGLHSNDGRDTTITVDPVTGNAAERVTPLA